MAAIQAYFGETQLENCGKCDNCIKNNKKGNHSKELKSAISKVEEWFAEHKVLVLEEFLIPFSKREEEVLIEAIRLFLNSGKLHQEEIGKFTLKQN